MPANPWLVLAGALSGAACLAHLAVIVGGAPWYRFFGAGERMARMAEARSLRPTVITLGIAAVLAVWAAYALAGAGLIVPLPLMRPVLAAISAVYLVRGLAPVPVLLVTQGRASPFWIWSSLIVLAFGIVYAVGTWRAWPELG